MKKKIIITCSVIILLLSITIYGLMYMTKVNINTASKEQLMQLPYVKEDISEKIIKYREEHKFKSPDELMNISGIKDKRFEALKKVVRCR